MTSELRLRQTRVDLMCSRNLSMHNKTRRKPERRITMEFQESQRTPPITISRKLTGNQPENGIQTGIARVTRSKRPKPIKSSKRLTRPCPSFLIQRSGNSTTWASAQTTCRMEWAPVGSVVCLVECSSASMGCQVVEVEEWLLTQMICSRCSWVSRWEAWTIVASRVSWAAVAAEEQVHLAVWVDSSSRDVVQGVVVDEEEAPSNLHSTCESSTPYKYYQF